MALKISLCIMFYPHKAVRLSGSERSGTAVGLMDDYGLIETLSRSRPFGQRFPFAKLGRSWEKENCLR